MSAITGQSVDRPVTASPPNPAQTSTDIKQNIYIGTLGVFLGAGIATMNGRLISVGLPDLRGSLGFGVDEAAWIPKVAPGGYVAIHDVFPDPADGGRPPYELYRQALDVDGFAEQSATGSLRILRCPA